jgi:glycosyltransferase involved in cell wall biosynthesis
VHSLEAYPTGLIGSWLAQRAGCPHVLTAHGTYGLVWRDSAPDRILYERVLRSAVAVLPVSQGTAGLMQQHFPRALQGVRVQPILNGNTFYKNVPDEWALTRPFPRPPVILTVGDVKPRKGQHASLAAFAQVQQRLPGTQYEIAGKFWDNAYYRGLQQMIAEQNLRGVRFHGMVSVEELQALYRSASVFVLAAQPEGLHVEGFGLVYLEAGAYGLPVVGTATGGVPDAVLHGETGLLAAPGDVGGLADGILSILQDETLARRLGQANRRRSEELTWEHCAEEHLQVYREVV